MPRPLPAVVCLTVTSAFADAIKPNKSTATSVCFIFLFSSRWDGAHAKYTNGCACMTLSALQSSPSHRCSAENRVFGQQVQSLKKGLKVPEAEGEESSFEQIFDI